MVVLRQFGNRLPTPRASVHHDGHFSTYLELQTRAVFEKEILASDEGLPSGSHGRCTVCPMFCFTSASDKEKHMRVLHGLQTPHQKPPTAAAQPVCKFDGCGLIFSTKYQLLKHKKEAGHVLPRGRPKRKK